jgi:hypothetical protein
MAHPISRTTEALHYASELRLRVSPLTEGTKIPPAGSRGFHDATTDPDKVKTAFDKCPGANIAIATGGGLLVVDIDPRHGGHESIASLKASGRLFGQCPLAKTGNGGRHLYFAISEPIKCRTAIWPGVDIKADGGYVVAPSSRINASKSGPGGTYVWLIDPFRMPLQPLPDWLLTELQLKPIARKSIEASCSPFSAVRRLDGLARFVAGAANGSRNAALNWASFKAADLIRENQIGASEVVGTLRTAAIHAGLDAREIAATIESGLRAGFEKGGAANV